MNIDLFLLFISAFTAATLLPAQSELLIVALATLGEHSPWALLSVASAGNILGSLVNWLLGRYLIDFKDKPWFPIKEKPLNKARTFYTKYGVWSLLLAWAPIIGDPLTLVAGIFKAPLGIFLILVAIGKVARYALLLAVA